MNSFLSLPTIETVAIYVICSLAILATGALLAVGYSDHASHFAYCAAMPLAPWEIASGVLSFSF